MYELTPQQLPTAPNQKTRVNGIIFKISRYNKYAPSRLDLFWFCQWRQDNFLLLWVSDFLILRNEAVALNILCNLHVKRKKQSTSTKFQIKKR